METNFPFFFWIEFYCYAKSVWLRFLFSLIETITTVLFIIRFPNSPAFCLEFYEPNDTHNWQTDRQTNTKCNFVKNEFTNKKILIKYSTGYSQTENFFDLKWYDYYYIIIQCYLPSHLYVNLMIYDNCKLFHFQKDVKQEIQKKTFWESWTTFHNCLTNKWKEKNHFKF